MMGIKHPFEILRSAQYYSSCGFIMLHITLIIV